MCKFFDVIRWEHTEDDDPETILDHGLSFKEALDRATFQVLEESELIEIPFLAKACALPEWQLFFEGHLVTTIAVVPHQKN
jgi:hypothetical protein